LICFAGSQENRFSVALSAVLHSAAGKAKCAQYSVTADELGVHSIRKGSSSYVSSGSTAGPSFASICNRAGWTLGGVQERYLKFEGAGDQFVGRTVRGVSLDSSDFPLLPPHFPSRESLEEILPACFPGLAGHVDGVSTVLRYGLASVVYHSAFLQSELRSNHPLFNSSLFTRQGLLFQLHGLIRVGLHSDDMNATGIPPYSAIMRRQEDTLAKLDSMPGLICTQIAQTLEENGAAAANVTPAGLKSTLTSILEQLLPGFGVVGNAQQINVQEEVPGSKYLLYSWDGRLHRVPKDFDFPKCNVAVAFQLWYLGNSEKGYPPFKNLEPSDLADGKKRKCLSDWRYMMNVLENALGDDSELNGSNLSEQLLRQQLALARERLGGPQNKKKRCRQEDWKLVTAVREMRAQRKRIRVEVRPVNAADLLVVAVVPYQGDVVQGDAMDIDEPHDPSVAKG
jgi:hypothetical protein